MAGWQIESVVALILETLAYGLDGLLPGIKPKPVVNATANGVQGQPNWAKTHLHVQNLTNVPITIQEIAIHKPLAARLLGWNKGIWRSGSVTGVKIRNPLPTDAAKLKLELDTHLGPHGRTHPDDPVTECRLRFFLHVPTPHLLPDEPQRVEISVIYFRKKRKVRRFAIPVTITIPVAKNAPALSLSQQP